MKLQRQISKEEFYKRLIVKRKLYTNGKVEYTGEFEMYGDTYSDNLKYKMNEPEDLWYYDNFAREQLSRLLLKQVNNGV